MTHSPAPWKWATDDFTLCDANKNMLLFYTTNDDGVHTENDADKKLIEAAPDLLMALQFLMQSKFKSIDRDNMEFEARFTCFQLDKARAAIAKATAT